MIVLCKCRHWCNGKSKGIVAFNSGGALKNYGRFSLDSDRLSDKSAPPNLDSQRHKVGVTKRCKFIVHLCILVGDLGDQVGEQTRL